MKLKARRWLCSAMHFPLRNSNCALLQNCGIDDFVSHIKQEKFDVLIVGAGLAGFMAALKLADHRRVALASKSLLSHGNSPMAQGGIAAVMALEDSLEQHVQDTLIAGAGLCNEEIVRKTVADGPERVQELIDWGVRFDVDLTREGGHSQRRILHIKDHTGKELHDFLLNKVRLHPNIKIFDNMFAVDLLTRQTVEPHSVGTNACFGAWFIDRRTLENFLIWSDHTVLATGGAGKVYRYTSNWSGATGDGIAMAARAGARVGNLEFMQFHPTCLYHPQARNFLISESLRGEGGELKDAAGHVFMKDYHPLGSLAPRDIVARSIDAEMKKSGADCVYLDMTHHPRSYLEERFDLIYNRCLELGIDMATQPLPVVPAAHYLCGGVKTNFHGQTDLANLYALGETAWTGLHGANRLASNSLLECLVGAYHCAQEIRSKNPEPFDFNKFRFDIPEPSEIEFSADEMIVVKHMWEEIRNLMWNYVGIVRTNRRLKRARDRLRQLTLELQDYYGQYRIHPDLVELRNIAIVADLTVQCALGRKESRGIHYNLDYLATDTNGSKDSIVQKLVGAAGTTGAALTTETKQEAQPDVQ